MGAHKHNPTAIAAKKGEVASDNNVGSKGVKIPVISMEDVPKIMEEMEKCNISEI